jgi:hypothetical protein
MHEFSRNVCSEDQQIKPIELETHSAMAYAVEISNCSSHIVHDVTVFLPQNST